MKPELRIVKPVDSSRRRLGAPGVVAQVTESLRPQNRLATALGFLLGGIVPLATYVVAHREIAPERPLYGQLAAFLVLGGLVYSARTVYDWGKLAFRLSMKALGFVVLIEGVMISSHTEWLSITALAYLIAINGVATGCTLANRRT